MEQVNIKYFDMPATIKAYTVCNQDDTYTIILNSRLCYEQQLYSYYHEMRHIENGDYCKNSNADIIEMFAH